MFPRIEYLHWIEGRADAADHDLATTNQQLGAPLDRLGSLPDLPAGTSLDDRLAAELDVSPDRLLVTAGATHANFLAMAAALEGPSDEVLVESPGYEPLVATPQGLGATVQRFDRPAEEGFALDPDRVVAAFAGDTALVVVTDRHNPSGRSTSTDALEAVGEAAADRDARLLVDEVYAPFGSADGPNFGGDTATGIEGAVVTGSLTKVLGLGDLRLGWLVADAAFIERARTVWAHVPTVSAVSRRLAGRVLADRTGQVARAKAHAATNAALLETFVDGRDDLDGHVFGPCPFAFPAHRSAGGDAVAEAAWDAGVLVVPGRFFGDPDRFRIAAAAEPAVTQRSLDAFGAGLDGL